LLTPAFSVFELHANAFAQRLPLFQEVERTAGHCAGDALFGVIIGVQPADQGAHCDRKATTGRGEKGAIARGLLFQQWSSPIRPERIAQPVWVFWLGRDRIRRLSVFPEVRPSYVLRNAVDITIGDQNIGLLATRTLMLRTPGTEIHSQHLYGL
jgi:hypothetical protein